MLHYCNIIAVFGVYFNLSTESGPKHRRLRRPKACSADGQLRCCRLRQSLFEMAGGASAVLAFENLYGC